MTSPSRRCRSSSRNPAPPSTRPHGRGRASSSRKVWAGRRRTAPTSATAAPVASMARRSAPVGVRAPRKVTRQPASAATTALASTPRSCSSFSGAAATQVGASRLAGLRSRRMQPGADGVGREVLAGDRAGVVLPALADHPQRRHEHVVEGRRHVEPREGVVDGLVGRGGVVDADGVDESPHDRGRGRRQALRRRRGVGARGLAVLGPRPRCRGAGRGPGTRGWCPAARAPRSRRGPAARPPGPAAPRRRRPSRRPAAAACAARAARSSLPYRRWPPSVRCGSSRP